MARAYNFKIGTVAMPNPTSMKYGENPVGIYFRLLNADMITKGIALKMKVTAHWDFLTYAEADLLLQNTVDIFESTKNQEQDIQFTWRNATKTMHTYFSPFELNETPDSSAAGGYANVDISFIQT